MNIKNKIIDEDINFILNAHLPWNKLKNKSILITGGNGFIASYIIKSLLKADIKFKLGLKVISVIRKTSKSKIIDPKLKIIKTDINNLSSSDIPQADMVIHAASKASPRHFKNKSIDIIKTNTLATINLLELAKEKSERFLYISSGEIYGEMENHNITINEDLYGRINHLNKRAVYAESKRMGEAICNAYVKNKGLRVFIARPIHTYGPGISLKDGRVFSDFVNSVVNRKDIVLTSLGNSKRPFCYISDAVIALFTILLKGKNANAYNVANPNCEVKIKDLALILSKLIPNNTINIKLKNSKNMSNPLKRQKVSINKIKNLNWVPTIGIREGFKKTINYYM